MNWIWKKKKVKRPMPQNLRELLVELEETLPAQTIDKLKSLKHEDLGDCHFGFNMYLRNTYLWHDQTPLMQMFRETTPFPDEDSVSAFITEAFWMRLNGTKVTPTFAYDLLRTHHLLYEGKRFPHQTKSIEEGIADILGED